MARTKASPSKTPRSTQKARKTISASAIRSYAFAKVSPSSKKSKPAPSKKTTRKLKYGVKVLREIRSYQNSTKLLVPRAPMVRCIKEVIQSGSCKDFRITAGAVDAIREAVESYLVDMFEVCNLFAIHAKRKTVMPKDVNLWKQIKKMMNS